MSRKTDSISKTLPAYAAVFLIPLTLRLLPELQYTYPLGVDTPYYMYVMQYGELRGEYWQTNIFYNLINLLGKAGVDAMVFFKVYPPFTYAVTCLLIAVYLRRELRWDLKSLLIFSTVFSLVPALLRTSLDLHRQNFALLLLSLALVLTTVRGDWRLKAFTISAVYILIGLVHELVFAVALFIQLWSTGKSLVRGEPKRDTFLPLAAVAISILVYATLKPRLLLSYISALFITDYHPLGVNLVSGWERFDWWISIGLLAYGFILPLAVLGRVYDDRLFPWFIISVVPYTSFVVSYVSFNMPERWLYLAGVPMSVYAANFLRRFSLGEPTPYILIALITIQPLSMLGVTPLPLTVYAEKRYGAFADRMSTSVPEEQIRAFQLFREKANHVAGLIFIVPYEHARWAAFFFPKNIVIPSDWPEARNTMNKSNLTIVYVSDKETAPNGYKLAFSYGGLKFYTNANLWTQTLWSG